MKPSVFITLLASLLFAAALQAATVGEPKPGLLNERAEAPAENNNLTAACASYNELNSRIRDGRIAATAARIEVVQLLSDVRKEYYRRGGRDYAATEWIFPLAGHDLRAIGGGRNHGFVPGGYDFFSGNRHGGHPAYDIFIRDRNQDSRDDRTGQPVRVLSLTGGVVVALERQWEASSSLRGGKYVWIYDPANDLLVYYAHNDELYVRLGEIVEPGQPLATVGRSGLNAAKRRSPTHLHFSVLRLVGGRPQPLNVYSALQRARKVAEH